MFSSPDNSICNRNFHEDDDVEHLWRLESLLGGQLQVHLVRVARAFSVREAFTFSKKTGQTGMVALSFYLESGYVPSLRYADRSGRPSH